MSCRSKLERHLLIAHRGEDAVKKYAKASGANKSDLLKLLRNKGRLEYNRKALGRGEDLIVHGNIKNHHVSDLRVCNFCSGLFSRQHVYRHRYPGIKEGCPSSSSPLAPADGEDVAAVERVAAKIADLQHRCMVQLDPLLRRSGFLMSPPTLSGISGPSV